MPANSWTLLKRQLGLANAFCISYAIASSGNSALAQNITVDGSLGPAQTLTGPNYVIPQAVGQTVGNNLFHSFGQFSLDTGESAGFQSAANIQNILSRVTGGFPSIIDGRIFTTSPSVNLFLINPSGISFGPNAKIDVGGATRGSFVATTANAIRFGSTGAFVASTSQTDVSLLTVNPSAFLFNQIAAASITSQANLQVDQGQSLLLVGGDVSLNGGTLNAPGGRVELGGVAGRGTVRLNADSNNLRLSFPDGVDRADVSLANGAEVNVAAGGGGSIALNARNVDVLEGSGLRAGIKPLSGAVGAQAGDITLNATGVIKIENGFIYNAAFDAGNGGNLRIDTGQLIIQDGVVATATLSQGRAGELTVNASDSVELTGSPSSNGTIPLDISVEISFGPFVLPIDFPITVPIGLFAASLEVRDIAANIPDIFAPLVPQSGGDAGNLTINTGRLIVRDGAVVSAGTASEGRAGDLTVNANFVELSGTSPNDSPRGTLTIANRVPSGLRNETSGLGPGGNLTINTGQLIVRDGAWVTAGTAGEKPGGTLRVNASDSVNLIGTASANGLPSVLAAGTQGSGASGDLTINTRQFIVRDGAVVSAGTSNAGQGGNLTVNASDSVELIGTSRVGLTADLLEALVGASGISLVGVVEDLPYPSGLITGTAGDGDAGNLTIDTRRLLIRDGAQASVSTTTGAGNAGRLRVRASEVELTGTSRTRQSSNVIIGPSLLTTAVSQQASGNGGDLTIETGRLTIQDGAQVSASTLGKGKGGDIQVRANSLSLTSGAQVSASTSGVGSAGSIFVREADTVSLNNSTISTAVNPGAEGEGGNVEIATDSLSLDNNAQISASTSGVGNAGGVLVQAQDAISLRDGSQISSTVESTAVGNGREIQLQARTLSLTNGAQVNASTSGQGDAGSIRVNTTEAVSLSGDNSRLSTSTNSSGSGGSITVDTGAFRVSERAVLDATTSNAGNGGNITVNSNSFDATDGGKLQASTSGSGRAGDITVDIADRMRVDGTDSGLFASTTASSTGNGGDVRIEAGSASLTDGAQVSASTSGQGSSGNIQLDVPDGELLVKDGAEVTVSGLSGQAGNLTVTADSIRLENEGKLTAVTGVGEGGNITLRDVDLLLMRDRSEISAEARGTANGGNITIDANFIVAVPSENSDITANAVEGNGGRVSITAQGLFGIEFREQRTPLSDITASSEFGVDGVVEINAPEVDPSRGLTALPAEVVDASNQIAQNCPASGGTVAQSELIVTGRGGLPDNPIEALSSDAVWTDLRPTTRATGRVEEGARGRISPTSSTTEAPKQLVEAQGWIINDKGKVVLTAQAVPVVPHSPWHKPADCPVK